MPRQEACLVVSSNEPDGDADEASTLIAPGAGERGQSRRSLLCPPIDSETLIGNGENHLSYRFNSPKGESCSAPPSPLHSIDAS